MCNGGGNSVKKFADGGSTGTKSKSAPKRPDSGGSNPKPAPKPTVAAAPNRAKAGDASFQKSVADRELDRLVQQTLSAPLPASSPARGYTPVGSMPKNPDTFLNKAGDFLFPDTFRPQPNSRKTNFAVEMGAPLLNNAYDLASTALTMTPDTESYVPVPVQRLNHYLSNMGLAGLSAVAAPVYGAAGLTADVANKLGVPRPEALARDLGAMLDSAGILPEGRMLASMLPDAPAPRVSRVPEDIPTETPAEMLMNRTDVAPITPPAAETNIMRMTPDQIAAETQALRQQLRDRTDLADNEADFLTDRPEGYYDQVPEPDYLVNGPLDPVDYGPEFFEPLDPYVPAAEGNPLDPWRYVEDYAPVREARTLAELDETPYYDLMMRADADDMTPLTLEERRELLDYTFDDYTNRLGANRLGADPALLPPETYEGQNRMALDDAAHRLRYLTGDERYEAYVSDPTIPFDPRRPQLRLGPLDATRTLDELTADTNYADMINQYSAPRVNGVLNMGEEDLQSLLDSTYDEFLHRVDQPGFLDTPAGERTMSNIVTRLQALTGEDYRYYAFLGEGDPPTQRPQLRPDMKFSPAPILAPLTQSGTGIASMYSPTRRAVDQLRQSKFPDPVSLEKQLLAMGAKPDELESLMKRLEPSDIQGGGLNRDRLNQLAEDAATEVQQVRAPDTVYGLRSLVGATDPHVTTFEAPVTGVPQGIGQHFESKLPGNSVLAHIRSAMFKTPGSNKLNVYHLTEVQSDWAQFRAKLFKNPKEAEDALLEVDRRVAELEAAGLNPRSDSDLNSLAEKAYLTKEYGFRPDLDKDYPAPYVKTTRKWHQLGLKQALIEAVNSGSDYMSLSTGEQVRGYTGGKLEGQQKFYDEMTPRELDDILTKFSKEAGVEKPVIEQITIEGEPLGRNEPRSAYTHTVPAIRLTDEFKEAMKKYGLPSFAKGGIVSLPNRTS